MANGKGKKSKKKLIIFGVIGVLVIVIALLVIFSGNKEAITTVQTENVERRTITQVVSATGKINPEFSVKISAEATGEIVQLLVQEGDNVKKGQLLLRIKPDIYQAQKNRAEASLAQARSQLNVRKANLDQIESEYKRVQGLFDKGLASDADIEVARSNYLQRKGEYAGQQSLVQQTEASLNEAVENLNKTYIYSPLDGTVSKLDIELGERVLGSGYSPGTELLTVADLTKMEATVNVDENDVVLVSVGDTANVKIDAFGDRMFHGIVTQIGNTAVTTGSGSQDEVVNFEVKIKLPNESKEIRPGMSCDADIRTETKHNVLSVPIQSVTARTDKPMIQTGENAEAGEAQQNKPVSTKVVKPKEVVFIVKNNTANMKEVKTGISDDAYIEIESGLNGGEQVVSGPYRAISRELENNSKVMVESKKKGSDKDKSAN